MSFFGYYDGSNDGAPLCLVDGFLLALLARRKGNTYYTWGTQSRTKRNLPLCYCSHPPSERHDAAILLAAGGSYTIINLYVSNTFWFLTRLLLLDARLNIYVQNAHS